MWLGNVQRLIAARSCSAIKSRVHLPVHPFVMPLAWLTPRRRGAVGSLLLYGTMCVALATHAAEPLPDRRAVRPQAPVMSPGTAAPSREVLLDLMSQLDALQNEVRLLRGQLEVQAHELEQMKQRQRNATGDFDQRLQAVERRAPAAAPPPSGGPTTIVTPPVSSSDAMAPPSAGEQQAYDAAFALMKQGQYEQAATGFRQFIARHPTSALAGNAQYWVAEAAYVTRNYKAARDEFEKVVSRYPSSPKAPDALLKLGFSHYELGTFDKARESLNQVVSRYPNTPAAKSAEARLAKMAKEAR